MRLDLINLLPADRARTLRRDYFYHLITIALLILTLLTAMHAALLLPTYRYLENQVSTRTERLDALDQTLGSADEQSLAKRLSALESETSKLSSLATSTPQSKVLGEVLAEPHPGITLSSIALTPPKGKAFEMVVLSGKAVTRDDLRQYFITLQTASFVKTANLPVSAYAAESNLPFAITLTLP